MDVSLLKLALVRIITIGIVWSVIMIGVILVGGRRNEFG